MGRSAKLHKRVDKKKTKSSAQPKLVGGAQPAHAHAEQSATVSAKKASSGLKAKTGKSKSKSKGGHVLGGADYVDLMLGGRRKAREEATKLPQDQD